MAILDLTSNDRPGILKVIDEGAMDLVFQAIQEDIYSFPIQSFVRESISNGLDAITERTVYKAIASGKPVESYYRQQQDGRLLKDSEFTPEYYNANHLSMDNKVYVNYKSGTPRDTISIKDFGVGLGGDRLKGFFKIGYSSKRNMKLAIGKFGAGAKAGLATGVEYFILKTVYNGYTASFMILKNDYEAITPESEGGKEEIWRVQMSDKTFHDKKIYWERCADKNSVEIILEVKKHNQKHFINAVKNQFQYFSGRVQLSTMIDDQGKVDRLNEKPLYESEILLIPKYSTYTAPHILVDGISYGLISWPELELQNRVGKIALKVSASDVDITQSRESLKWTEKTKKKINEVIELAQDEATEYMTSLLALDDPSDLFAMNTTYGKLTKNAENEVSTVFSKFLDMHNLKPRFSINTIKLGKIDGRIDTELFEFLFYNFRFRNVSLSHKDGKVVLNTVDVDNFFSLREATIVYGDEANLGPKLADHIINQEFPSVNSIVYVRPRTDRVKFNIEYKKVEYKASQVAEYVKGMLQKFSDLNLDTYDVVYANDTIELENAKVNSKESAARMRKANKEVIYTYYEDVELNPGDKDVPSYSKMRRETVRIADLELHFAGYNVVITTGKYKGLGKLVEFTQHVYPIKNDDLIIIYVSEENARYFLPYGTLISDYLRQVNTKTGELMIGEYIRNLNTLKKYSEVKAKYRAFSGNTSVIRTFTDIDTYAYEKIQSNTKDYDVKELLKTNYSLDAKMVDTIFGYLDTLSEFHTVVKTGNKDDITETALRLFNTDKIHHIDAYDEEFITSIENQLERLNVIAPVLELFNNDSYFGDAQELLELLIITKQQKNDHI